MKKEIIKTEMIVKDTSIRVMRVGNIDYISLTDLAKYENSIDPSGVIRNWMSNKESFAFYSLWEELNNDSFNSVESHRIKIEEVGYNRFTMTPNRWKKEFNAIGIIPSSGKYSLGTFAHPDIAFEFASWLNVEFKLYLITEFERLKQNESYQNKIKWSVKRELAKTNYLIHTDSIKENLIPILTEKITKLNNLRKDCAFMKTYRKIIIAICIVVAILFTEILLINDYFTFSVLTGASPSAEEYLLWNKYSEEVARNLDEKCVTDEEIRASYTINNNLLTVKIYSLKYGINTETTYYINYMSNQDGKSEMLIDYENGESIQYYQNLKNLGTNKILAFISQSLILCIGAVLFTVIIYLIFYCLPKVFYDWIESKKQN